VHRSAPSAPPARAGRREWIGLAVLTLPTLLVSVDVFVMLLALPHLSSDLGAGSTEQLWIMDTYAFLLAGFLITMGTVGDLIGRRRLLLLGGAGFGLASVLCAYSVNPEMLILARGLLGVAGATLAPSTLALISNMFADPRQRGLAISVWLAAFMGGAATGPVIGGLLLENYWWGSVFLLGVPVMVLLLGLGPVLLPEYRDTTGRRLDLISVAQSLAAILPVIYGLKELARNGWHPAPILAVLAGLAFVVLFVRRQHRLADPLLDLRLFADRAFSAALGSMLFGTMLMGAIMLLITQYLQLVAQLSPLRAGLWMLPSAGAATASFLGATLLVRRFRPAYLIGAGLAAAVLGLLLITQVRTTAGLGLLTTGFVFINLGSGPLLTLGTDLIVGSVSPAKAGSAAAMNETSGEFGFALGIAVLGSIATAAYRHELRDTLPPGLSPQATQRARDSLANASTAIVPDRLRPELLAAAQHAFIDGMRIVAGASALVLAGVAVLTVRLLRHVPATAAGNDLPEPSTAAPAG